mgnify:CR=1 FL=1
MRRAKLYYLRGLQGRAARIKELNPVQRRKAQDEAAAAAAEIAELIAAAEAEGEDLEIEEPVDDLEEQPTDDMELAEETPVDEAPADEPVAEEPAEEVSEEESAPEEDSAEEAEESSKE